MKQRGKRIRPSGKDLVFHFTIASLLPVFLLVVGLFHVKTIQQINWQDFNLSQADKIDIPYLIISFSVAILICLLVAFVFKRVRYDTVKQLYHRQKLAKMILENKWYESEQVKTEGFFKDSAGRTKEKITYFPKMYYRLKNGLMVFSLLLFVAILFSDEQDSGISNIHYGGVNVSAEVLAHKPMVEKYAKEYGVEEYVNILLAIIQVESGGTAEDVMQSSESLGLPPNSLSTEESIKQGVKYFSELLASSERLSVDLESVIQSYNYGGGFLGYVANRGNKYTFELAQSFSKEYSGGEKVSYPNPIAIPINGGWRYNYGNMFYVQLVTQYLVTTEFDDDTVQAIMDEALKYEGWRYVYGGASPTTSFDCSGLTQWTYGKAGINLPRTAQQQYDVTQHIPLSEAQAGDLVFFHSTYNAGSYITHVGIYLGNNRMFHAGDPIGYADLTSPYWQQHLVGAGRIKQ